MSIDPATFPHPVDRPLLVVIAGPSGSGKSSLIDAFLQGHPRFVVSVSATTRSPRSGERDGIDYHFLSEEEFQRQIAADGFLEYAQVFGRHFYGTPRSFVEGCFARGESVIMDIDVQGAAQIRGRMPESVQIFVVPPTVAELEGRLRGRGTEDEATIQRRLLEAGREIARYREFRYLVVNDALDRAVLDLASIVAAERLRLV